VPVARRAIPRVPPNALLPLIGFVAQNPIGFAYTSLHRPPQSTFQLQPVLALHLWDNGPAISGSQLGDGLASSFANVAAAEASGSAARWCVRGLSPMSLFVTGQWMVYRQFAPVAPQTTINFGMTMAFPSCNITGAGRTHRSRRISYVDHTGPFLPRYSRVVRIVQALSLTSPIAGSMFCLILSCASYEFLPRPSYPSPLTLPTSCSRALM
jgi:hypothetical protein